MSKTLARVLALSMALMLFAAACSSSSDKKSDSTTTAAAAKIDYTKIGLWDDGACDTSKAPLKLGLMTVFQSQIVSLEDQAKALEAAAKAFNSRGGANGSCIQVTTCDDGANVDQAVACVKKIDDAGVVATINDQGTAAQGEVAAAMRKATIPRVAGNVTNNDWDDVNAYPIDASGTGVTFMMPQALIEMGVKKQAIARVDLPEASALIGLIGDLYKPQGVSFVLDSPVPAGTTDYSQFILGAQNAGAGGMSMALGENEATQIVKAGQQLNSDLKIGASLGTFPHSAVESYGNFAENMSFAGSFPPATYDLPVYEALRQDLAASGDDALQPANLKTSPMRSWIGLYALLWMIRDQKVTDFTRANMTKMLQAATDVPMLGIFGDESWTPNKTYKGLWQRIGTATWGTYKWDSKASAPDGLKGNFVQTKTLNFAEILCGSLLGAPKDTCTASGSGSGGSSTSSTTTSG